MSFGKKGVPNCDTCPAMKNCFYYYLDRPAQRAWKEIRTAASFKDGEFVFNDGEKTPGLFIVCKGRVKIYKTSSTGQQLISRIEYAGDLLGHIALLAAECFESSAEVMGEATISLIDAPSFMDFLKKHPNAAIALIRALAKDVIEGDAKASDIAYKSAKSRMADVILKAAEISGPKEKTLRDVKRRELAEFAGLTVETAVRILAEFEKKKLIKRDGKEIVLMDKDALLRISLTDD